MAIMANSILVLTLACFFGRILSMENEPRCYSRFDYEVKLLEKTLQNDVQMKQVLEKLDNTLKAVEAEKAEFHEANERLKTLIDEFKENTSTELLQKLQSSLGAEKAEFHEANERLKTLIDEFKENTSTELLQKLQSSLGATTPVVLFNARTLKNPTPYSSSRLEYIRVSQNIGAAFDPDTCIFTAPVNGTYLFTVQICTRQNKWGAVKIVVNNKEVRSIVSYNDAVSYTTTSGTTVQSLEKGSQVWVKQNIDNSHYYDGSNNGWNQFSGVLLHH